MRSIQGLSKSSLGQARLRTQSRDHSSKRALVQGLKALSAGSEVQTLECSTKFFAVLLRQLKHLWRVPLRHSSQRLLNVLWCVSNLQAQSLLNQLVPCSDNAIIADEDKRDLRQLGCLAQPPLQPVRHIRVDVQDGNRCLAKTPCPFMISFASLRSSASRRARDENCPLRRGSSPPAIRGTGKADPADRSMRQISPQAERRVHNSTPHSPALLVPAQVALAQRAPSRGSLLAST